MKTINVLNSYRVHIGSNILKEIPDLIELDNYSKIFVITDTIVKKYCLEKLEQALSTKILAIAVVPGEKNKNIETVRLIWEKLLSLKADRKSLIINLGGGVIGDMGGFAASTYMRGLDFIQIPTTLLAQVDSSVGGKVGINFSNIKNLIGSFNQPKAVFCDITFLSTLPTREFIEGFGEIIKHGIIADRSYFDFITSKKPSDFTDNELVEIVSKSAEIKSAIISKDEKEENLRKLVNFGHTVGHAIESLSLKTDKPLLHGEAISLGMIVETEISYKLGLISEGDSLKIKQSLKNVGLPTDIPDFPVKQIMDKIQSDKKIESGQIKWTLISSIGQALINQSVPNEVIAQSYEEN